MTRPVFLTGGTGFVGGALLTRLVGDGHEVRALARSAKGAEMVSSLGAEPMAGDLFDHDVLVRAMQGCAIVFHVAGVNAMCVRDPSPMFRANVEGAGAVVRAAAAAGVRRVVHTSSAATIGEPRGVVGTEDAPHRGSFLSSYEKSKYLGEREVLSLGAELGVEVVCVNPSSVQGPGRTGGPARLLLGLVNGRAPVIVDTYLSIVDIADCTEAHVLAATRGIPGQRYLASGATLTPRSAVTLLRAETGHPRHVVRLPRAAATLAGAAGSAISSVTSRDLPLCLELARTLLHGHRYDGSLAERDLGLRYTPLPQTVRRTLEWYAERGLAPVPFPLR
jgi:Nucleoside-diphosphate-sugar epimerases